MTPFAYEMYLRGELWLQMGEPERAVDALEEALRAPASRELDPFVLARLALALHRTGDEEGARQRLAEADERAPCLLETWRVRGQIAMDTGDPRTALAAYDHALRCDPEDPVAQRRRLELLTLLGADARALALRNDAPMTAVPPPEAREAALREAIEAGDREEIRRLLPPDNVVPRLPWPLRARALAWLGDREGAARAWRRAAPLREEDLADAAGALAAAEAWSEAAAAAESALARTKDPAERRAMAEIWVRAQHAKGQTHEALASLPESSLATLAGWLDEAGLRGLAQALRGATSPGAAGAPATQ